MSIIILHFEKKTVVSAPDLKRSVRRNMHWLIDNIEAEPHVDYLYSYEAINEEEYQAINSQCNESGKVLKFECFIYIFNR